MWGAQVLAPIQKSKAAREQEKNRSNCVCGGGGVRKRGELLNRPEWDQQQKEIGNTPSLYHQMPRDELAKDIAMKQEQRSS